MVSLLAVSVAALDIAVPALRQALDSSADWRMERELSGSGRTLVSTGTVECVAGKGIKWTVLHPFPSSVEMTAETMIFADEDGTHEKSLEEMPHYAEIRARTDSFAAGDEKAFEGLFELDAELGPDGRGWTVRMVPEVRAMRRLFKLIELTGDETLSGVVMKTGDGGTSRIWFKRR